MIAEPPGSASPGGCRAASGTHLQLSMGPSAERRDAQPKADCIRRDHRPCWDGHMMMLEKSHDLATQIQEHGWRCLIYEDHITSRVNVGCRSLLGHVRTNRRPSRGCGALR